jgi:hypothetical protein
MSSLSIAIIFLVAGMKTSNLAVIHVHHQVCALEGQQMLNSMNGEVDKVSKTASAPNVCRVYGLYLQCHETGNSRKMLER